VRHGDDPALYGDDVVFGSLPAVTLTFDRLTQFGRVRSWCRASPQAATMMP